MPNDPWALCPCGHPWLRHDVEEYREDGTETCCVEGCSQVGCPGRTRDFQEPAPVPPCPECGPGYRYGDDGCRHTPIRKDDHA